MPSDTYKKAENVVSKFKVASFATSDKENMPHIKALLVTEREGLEKFYFCSNVSSKRYKQIISNPKSCVYFYDKDTFEGVCLYGEAQISVDKEILTRLWQDGMERIYPGGVDDEDYCAIIFNAKYGNYYRGLKNTDFDIINKGEIDAN